MWTGPGADRPAARLETHAVGNRFETPAKILDAALGCIAAHGPAKMSLRDVSAAAEVSRGTLYRYFKTKGELLTAISEHVRRGVSAALDEAVAEQPVTSERLRATADAIMHYGDDHPEVSRVIEAEPAFALQFIRDIFPTFVAQVTELLEPVFDDLAIVQEGKVRREVLAELLLRATSSLYLIPTPNPDEMTDAVVTLWASVATAEKVGDPAPEDVT
nr:TetR/AcrR family transcriptional regulator [Frankia gtarii]